MDNQNKFMTKWATWHIAPEGYAFVGFAIDDNEDEWKSRHERIMKNPAWNGYKFIRVPIAIPVPDEAVNKIIQE